MPFLTASCCFKDKGQVSQKGLRLSFYKHPLEFFFTALLILI